MTKLLWIAAMGCATCLAGGAYAQTPPPAPAPAGSAVNAEEFMRQGNAAFKKGDFAGARAAYAEAWRLKPVYDIAGDLGASELALGQFRDAAEHLAFSQSNFPVTGDPVSKEHIEQALKEALKHVEKIGVTVSVSGASVAVDGKESGTSPLKGSIYVDPGKHTIKASLEGYQDDTKTVDATAGADASVELNLSPVPTAPVRHRSKPVIIAGVIVTAAAAGAAIALTAVANSKGSSADTATATLGAGGCRTAAATCDTINSDLKSRDAMSNAAVGLFIGAGIVGVATLVYAVSGGSAKKPATTGAITLSPSARGLELEW